MPLVPNYYCGLREQIKPGARICVHLEAFDFVFEQNAFTEQTYISFFGECGTQYQYVFLFFLYIGKYMLGLVVPAVVVKEGFLKSIVWNEKSLEFIQI